MNGPHIQFFAPSPATRSSASARTKASPTPGSGWRYGPATTMSSRRTPRLRGLPVELPHGHRGGPLPERPAGVRLRAALRPGASPGRRHPGPSPRRERQGVPLLPGGGGRPAGAGPRASTRSVRTKGTGPTGPVRQSGWRRPRGPGPHNPRTSRPGEQPGLTF